MFLCCQLLNAHCKGNNQWISLGGLEPELYCFRINIENQPGHQPWRTNPPGFQWHKSRSRSTCIQTFREATEFTPLWLRVYCCVKHHQPSIQVLTFCYFGHRDVHWFEAEAGLTTIGGLGGAEEMVQGQERVWEAYPHSITRSVKNKVAV